MLIQCQRLMSNIKHYLQHIKHMYKEPTHVWHGVERGFTIYPEETGASK